MNSLLKKLKGYQKAPRARFRLLSEGVLTHEEFLLYELSAAIFDWDPRHETYGTFKATNQELAMLLGWKSDTTALKHKNSLIRKKFFTIIEDNRILVRGYEKWLLRKSTALKYEEETAEKQLDVSKIEDKASEIKGDQFQNGAYSLVSSKVNLSLSNEIPNEFISDKELDNIAIDIDYQNSLLTAEKGATYAD